MCSSSMFGLFQGSEFLSFGPYTYILDRWIIFFSGLIKQEILTLYNSVGEGGHYTKWKKKRQSYVIQFTYEEYQLVKHMGEESAVVVAKGGKMATIISQMVPVIQDERILGLHCMTGCL